MFRRLSKSLLSQGIFKANFSTLKSNESKFNADHFIEKILGNYSQINPNVTYPLRFVNWFGILVDKRKLNISMQTMDHDDRDIPCVRFEYKFKEVENSIDIPLYQFKNEMDKLLQQQDSGKYYLSLPFRRPNSLLSEIFQTIIFLHPDILESVGLIEMWLDNNFTLQKTTISNGKSVMGCHSDKKNLSAVFEAENLIKEEASPTQKLRR